MIEFNLWNLFKKKPHEEVCLQGIANLNKMCHQIEAEERKWSEGDRQRAFKIEKLASMIFF